MLEIRLIKKIFDNFEIEDYDFEDIKHYLYVLKRNTPGTDIKKLKRFYRDFLQIVIEVINKNFLDSVTKKYYIHFDTHIIIMDGMGIPNRDFKAKKISSQSKEKAIRFIMETNNDSTTNSRR